MKGSVHVSSKNLMQRLRRTVTAFKADVDRAGKDSARVATAAGRAKWQSRKDRRPRAPGRPGRDATTQVAKVIHWNVTSTGAAFNVKRADREAPHWFIHEIGTGKSAKMQRPKHEGRTGRPSKGQPSIVRRVKSQKGRRITRNLVWSDGAPMVQQQSAGPRARVRRSGGGQLMLAADMGVPARTHLMTIKKEIDGKHFVMRGTTKGFRQFNTMLMAAGEKHWNKRP